MRVQTLQGLEGQSHPTDCHSDMSETYIQGLTVVTGQDQAANRSRSEVDREVWERVRRTGLRSTCMPDIYLPILTSEIELFDRMTVIGYLVSFDERVVAVDHDSLMIMRD
jgi:hypothetical protein